MNTDTIQRLTHFLAHLEDIKRIDFETIRKYLSSTEYDTSFGHIFESVEDFYNTRQNTFPDLDWMVRQYPSYFEGYRPIDFHSDDLFVLTSILRDESYKNKVLSATYKDDLNKSFELLTEYKQTVHSNVQAPETAKEVFEHFEEERELFGNGVKTGISQLDTDLDFLPYKGFTAIVAPTKSFKTMTACNIVYDAVVNQGKNVLYFTLEDQYRSIWANIVSKHAYLSDLPISTAEIKKYKLSNDRTIAFQKVQDNFDASMTGHLAVISSEILDSFVPDEIKAKLEHYQNRWGHIDMVVVDHFSIMDDPIPGKNLSGPALSKAYVRFLTKESISFGERGFVLLGLGQVTREYTEALIRGEKMQSTGVANTSEMERSATIMLCTYSSEEMKKSNKISISIILNRNGVSDVSYDLPMKPEYALIGDYNKEYLEDEVRDAICAGKLDLPIVRNKSFGMSFKELQIELNLD